MALALDTLCSLITRLIALKASPLVGPSSSLLRHPTCLLGDLGAETAAGLPGLTFGPFIPFI